MIVSKLFFQLLFLNLYVLSIQSTSCSFQKFTAPSLTLTIISKFLPVDNWLLFSCLLSLKFLPQSSCYSKISQWFMPPGFVCLLCWVYGMLSEVNIVACSLAPFKRSLEESHPCSFGIMAGTLWSVRGGRAHSGTCRIERWSPHSDSLNLSGEWVLGLHTSRWWGRSDALGSGLQRWQFALMQNRWPCNSCSFLW